MAISYLLPAWFWQGVSTSVVASVMVAVAIGILKYRSPDPGRLISSVMYGLAAFCMLLVSCGAVSLIWYTSPHNRVDPDKLEATVRAWLDKSGMKYEVIPDPDAFFVVSVVGPLGMRVSIARPKPFPKVVAFRSVIPLTKENQIAISKQSGQQDSMMFGDLVQAGAQVRVAARVDSDKVVLIKDIPIDDLSEHLCIDALYDMSTATILSYNALITHIGMDIKLPNT
jgi:hypothetical protein